MTDGDCGCSKSRSTAAEISNENGNIARLASSASDIEGFAPYGTHMSDYMFTGNERLQKLL